MVLVLVMELANVMLGSLDLIVHYVIPVIMATLSVIVCLILSVFKNNKSFKIA